jgi:hypothetical protein
MRLSLDCFYGRFHSIRFSFRIDEAQAQSDEDYSNRDIEGIREIAIVCGTATFTGKPKMPPKGKVKNY